MCFVVLFGLFVVVLWVYRAVMRGGSILAMVLCILAFLKVVFSGKKGNLSVIICMVSGTVLC